MINSHYGKAVKIMLNVILFLIGMASALGKNLPSVTEYFPQLKGDLTKVNWAHAVNDMPHLQTALENDRVMMLEGDVVLGKLKGGTDLIPIMTHPPKTTSDLSLEMFINAIINAQKTHRKGIKLDFKSTKSFQSSWKVIDPLLPQINFPVLLNADIVSGPVESTVEPVNAETFFKLSSTKFPGSTLSVGWTTNFGPGMNGNYTWEQLDNMRKAIEVNNIKQPVTLCVRAGIAAQSPEIVTLVDKIDELQKSNTTSVTIWMSSDSDPVDVPKLRNLIVTLKKNRVFLDVPKFIQDQLKLDDYGKSPIIAVQQALLTLLTSVSAVFSNIFLP